MMSTDLLPLGEIKVLFLGVHLNKPLLLAPGGG